MHGSGRNPVYEIAARPLLYQLSCAYRLDDLVNEVMIGDGASSPYHREQPLSASVS